LATEKLLNLRIPLEGKPDASLAVQVYAFTRDGKFLAAAPVAEGRVTVPISPEQAAGAQIFIGPALRPNDAPTLALMEKMHAYKPILRLDPLKPEQELLPIPEVVWKLWCLRLCHVRGRVVKPVAVAGVVENKAVCHAKVHICEVDLLRLVLLKLPELVIWRLRDEVLHLIDDSYARPVIHFPIPEPDPAPYRQLKPELALSPAANLMPIVRKTTVAMETLPEAKLAKAPLAPLAAKLQPLLQAPSIQTVRKALLDHIDIIQPYLCGFPWFWPFITRCDEITTVFTNPDGQFEATFLYWACSDQPDLYFWVEFCVGGTWTTVYRKGVPCDTYWNYASGTEITLEVNDPRVPFCEPPKTVDGKKVAVLAIGDGVNVSQITAGLTKAGQPFGGSLEPHVWFGTGLAAAGITKYRWSYRQQGTVAWHVADHQVIRHYAVILPDDTVVFKAAVMGPEGPQQIFKIQPETAPEGGVWVPAVNSRLNTASAHFLSDQLGDPLAAAGIYDLKLELFTDAGVLVDPAAAGVQFVVPKETIDAPFTDTVETKAAPPEFFVAEGGHTAFRLVLRVDNNPCQAAIYPVSVGGHVAGPCGFIDYEAGHAVHISFKAGHPNDFATFHFDLSRGSTGTMESVSGQVGVAGVGAVMTYAGAPHTYNQAADVFAANVEIAGLVTSCAGRAAFCETLGVYAMATDGFYRLSGLDRYGQPTAFALVPATV
jgi:hypothetical protein